MRKHRKMYNTCMVGFFGSSRAAVVVGYFFQKENREQMGTEAAKLHELIYILGKNFRW